MSALSVLTLAVSLAIGVVPSENKVAPPTGDRVVAQIRAKEGLVAMTFYSFASECPGKALYVRYYELEGKTRTIIHGCWMIVDPETVLVTFLNGQSMTIPMSKMKPLEYI